MADKRPGIPQIDQSIPQNIAKVLGPLKEHAEIAQGIRSKGTSGAGYEGWKRRSVTLGMLVSAGVISEAKARELYDME
jgi:hypothetical protein